MNFSEAITAIKEGNYAYREAWRKLNFIKYDVSNLTIMRVYTGDPDTKVIYSACSEDILADDWIVVHYDKYKYSCMTTLEDAIKKCIAHPGVYAFAYSFWETGVAQIYDSDKDVFVAIRVEGFPTTITSGELRIPTNILHRQLEEFRLYIKVN